MKKIEELLLKKKPYEDELLSSWLTRLSHLNYLSLTTFLGSYFPNKGYSRVDIDLYEYNNSFFQTISKLTKIPIQDIKRLRLFKYEGFIEEKIHTAGRHHWFTPLHSSNEAKNLFFGIRFCPKCLKEKSYFRDKWRIMFINACTKHNCFLLNKCPKCSIPISFTKTVISAQIYNCFNCNYDLREAQIDLINNSSKEFYYMNLLNDITKKGYYIFQGKKYMSMGLFFLLRILVRNILKTTTKYEYFYIEQYSPKELYYVISEALSLLENYPKNLIYFCEKTKLTNNSVFFDKYRNRLKDIPSWFKL